MNKRPEGQFQTVIGSFVRAGTALQILMAFLVVIPLSLWFAWARHSTLVEPVVLTFFCLSFAWLNVSILRWQRCLRKMGWRSPARVSFGLGPQPEDPDELEIWRRGTHFRYSFIAVSLSMLAFGITKWLNGE